MDAFRFEPDLFECRTQALDVLNGEGYHWMEHFTSVDILHEQFGLEICGIASHKQALEVQEILHHAFPSWRHSHLSYKDHERDRGWKVVIYRDKQISNDEFLSV